MCSGAERISGLTSGVTSSGVGLNSGVEVSTEGIGEFIGAAEGVVDAKRMEAAFRTKVLVFERDDRVIDCENKVLFPLFERCVLFLMGRCTFEENCLIPYDSIRRLPRATAWFEHLSPLLGIILLYVDGDG